jgi:hypothetical protein
VICHQRKILDKKANLDPTKPYPNLRGFYVKEISKKESQRIILEYEWLGTMGRAFACYGLFIENELHGAINFGLPASPESRNICGVEIAKKAICLERGACTHLTPKNAASFFIKRAIRMAYKKYGWEVFYAYSDEEAGEIGTIYQACNWFYIGQGVGRRPGRKREYYLSPDDELISERTLRRRALKKSIILKQGWTLIEKMPKHKYVWFEGSKNEKKKLKELCRYEFKEYPKKNYRQHELNTIVVSVIHHQ